MKWPRGRIRTRAQINRLRRHRLSLMFKRRRM